MGRKATAALRSEAGGKQGGTNQEFILESCIWLNPRRPSVPSLAGRAQLEPGLCAAATSCVFKEAEPKAAGKPGLRPASDSASPDLCPGAGAILGSGCV